MSDVYSSGGGDRRGSKLGESLKGILHFKTDKRDRKRSGESKEAKSIKLVPEPPKKLGQPRFQKRPSSSFVGRPRSKIMQQSTEATTTLGDGRTATLRDAYSSKLNDKKQKEYQKQTLLSELTNRN